MYDNDCNLLDLTEDIIQFFRTYTTKLYLNGQSLCFQTR